MEREGGLCRIIFYNAKPGTRQEGRRGADDLPWIDIDSSRS